MKIKQTNKSWSTCPNIANVDFSGHSVLDLLHEPPDQRARNPRWRLVQFEIYSNPVSTFALRAYLCYQRAI